jgi:hypothetical protein
MRWYHYAFIVGSFFVGAALAEGQKPVAQPAAQDRVFEGPWKTINRKLDGIMTAVVKDLGNDKFQGRFYGVWQGVPFDYTVKFDGPPENLTGTAVIDHADYQWSGSIDERPSAQGPATFQGKFGGSRYTGYFDLKEKLAKPTARTAAVPQTAVER